MKNISIIRIAKILAIGSIFLGLIVIIFCVYLLKLNQIDIRISNQWIEPNQIGCGIERIGVRVEYRYGLYTHHLNVFTYPWYNRVICGG